jgi:methanogenic corrinoid protein MtbC1
MTWWKSSSLAILKTLQLGSRSVSEIVEETRLSQSNVSNHLSRLREMGLVLPHRAGKRVYYQMTDAALAQFVQSQSLRDGPPHDRAAAPPSDLAALQQEFLRAVLEQREDLEMQTVQTALSSGLSWKQIFLEIFCPTQVEIGRLWEAGELDVATEHAATAMTERLMSRLAQPHRPPWMEPVGSVVVACVEGEHHCVGARMVADFFIDAGWETHYLGPNVPRDELTRFVAHTHPDAVALSIALPEHGREFQESVERLRATRGSASLPILLGGGQGLNDDGELRRGLDVVDGDLDRAIAHATAAVQKRRGIAA